MRFDTVLYHDAANQLRSVSVRREIVLCAGALETPCILLRSGVGPANELAQVDGVNPLIDLPGVGRNLFNTSAPRIFPVFALVPPSQNPGLYTPAPADLFGGLLADQAFAAYRTPGATVQPANEANVEMQMFFVWGVQPNVWLLIPQPHVGLFKARGSVRITSAQPQRKRLIELNYAWDPDTQNVDEEFVDAAYDLFSRLALLPANFMQVDGALPVNATREQFCEALLNRTDGLGLGGLHYMGTAKIGADNDPLAVCTQRLKVRGTHNVRVGDASAAPFQAQWHSAAPSMMIGARCAAFVLADNASACH